jgi:hypothetical protein
MSCPHVPSHFFFALASYQRRLRQILRYRGRGNSPAIWVAPPPSKTLNSAHTGK